MQLFVSVPVFLQLSRSDVKCIAQQQELYFRLHQLSPWSPGNIMIDVGHIASLVLCVQVLHEVGEKHGVSASCVAARWVLQQPGVAAIVLGARNATHIRVGEIACMYRTDCTVRSPQEL
jgi:predicted oxidoreductase